MDQLYPLLLCIDHGPAEPTAGRTTGAFEPVRSGESEPAAPPADEERRVEPPFSRPLTDREREAAFATIMHWAMHGGC